MQQHAKSVFDSTDRWISSITRASAGKPERDVEDIEKYSDKANVIVDLSLHEARLILDAYTKVERDAEKVRVKKLGRLGAEDFINSIRAKQKNKERMDSGELPQPAPHSLNQSSITPSSSVPSQVAPSKPSKVLAKQNKKKRERNARKSKIDVKKAEDELARAHETAIKIARQRSRRRILRKCFLHFALFVMSESERVDALKATLRRSSVARIRSSIFRRWRRYTAEINMKLEQVRACVLFVHLRGRQRLQPRNFSRFASRSSPSSITSRPLVASLAPGLR